MSTCKRQAITPICIEWLILLFLCVFLAVFSNSAKAITLAWDPSPDPTVTGYMVHHGTVSGTYTTHVDAGMTNTNVVSNLVPGTTYYFVVTAYNAARVESAYSNQVSKAEPSAAPVAAFVASATSGTAPLAMNFSNNSTGSISTYAWNFGDGTTSSSANPSKVYASVGTFSVSLTVTGPGGTNTLTKPGYITISTAGGPVDTIAPTAPGALSATTKSESRIDLAWAAATDNVAVTGYLVERCTGTSCTNFAEIASSTSTTFSNMGLTSGTTYRYRIRAVDAAGNRGPYSSVGSAITQSGATSTTPVAALGFNEGSGTTASDTSGNGHSATLVNGPAWISGRYGKALSFDGSNDVANLANGSTLPFGDADFTIMMWVKRTSTSGSKSQSIIAKCGTAWGTGCKQLLILDGRLRFATSSGNAIRSVTIRDTQWHHVAVTYAKSAGTVRIYVDGTLRTSANRKLDADNAAHAVSIGNLQGTSPLLGAIDEARIYNRALSATEIGSAKDAPL